MDEIFSNPLGKTPPVEASADHTDREALWRVELFGGLRLIRGSLVYTGFRTHRTGGLLGLLAYHRGREFPKEALAELLWPDELPLRALQSLQMALECLHRELEPGMPRGSVLSEREASVLLSESAVVTDIDEFRERILQAGRADSRPRRLSLLLVAAEQYRPDILSGHREEWILPAQAEIDDLYLGAVGALSQLHETDGEPGEALAVLRRALRIHPDAPGLLREVQRLTADTAASDADNAAAARHVPPCDPPGYRP
jgi:DNA-binding SARP family transcriptional activator